MTDTDERSSQESRTPALPTRTPAWLAGYGAYPRKLESMTDENWSGWDQAELDHMSKLNPKL